MLDINQYTMEHNAKLSDITNRIEIESVDLN